MGKYQENKKTVYLFVIAFWLGLLLQFHYQFIIVIAGIFSYYFLFKKIKLSNITFFVLGLAVGLSPLILFELKHSFYNLNTMILYAQNWSKVDRPGGITMPHYYISISFMLILTSLGFLTKFIKKISYKYFFIFALLLIIYSLSLYIPTPPHAFWAPTTPWNYLTEKKIYEIIKSTKLKDNFNIANLAYYDTPAVVIKYFMKRDYYQINYEDYYQNKYLFVISENDKYKINQSYEISTFSPHKILNQWKINNKFNMFLLERINK